MTIKAIQAPGIDLDRVAAGGGDAFLAIRDALSVLWSASQQQALALATRIGSWRDVAYAAGNFTTNGGGSWTVGSQDRFRYLVIDQLMLLDVALSGSTINNGATTELRITLPGGYKAAGTVGSRGSCVWSDNTPVGLLGGVFASGGGSFVSCQRYDTTPGAAFNNGKTLALGLTLAVEIVSPTGGA